MVLFDELRDHVLAAKLGNLRPAQVWENRPSLLFVASSFTLVLSVLLGGGTRDGFLSDAILELLTVPVFLVSLSSLLAAYYSASGRSAHFALTLCLAISLLPLIQLVPLPPQLWQMLPQRDEVARIFEVAGITSPWLPLSVAANATWLSALSLLPPLTVFIGVLQLGYRERRYLSVVLVIVGVVSAMIGLLQVAQGPSSSLRFFAFTNSSDGVGFFANRNHFAALLYVVVLYAAAWATDLSFTAGSWRNLRSLQSSTLALLTTCLLAIMIIIAAETVTRSRAGLGLMIVAMFGVFALPWMDRRKAAGSTAFKLILGAMIIVLLLAVQFALYRLLERFSTDFLQDARPIFAHNTLTAAWAYMPFGSGFGSFMSVYPMFETPKDTLANTYANHAHNDFLEVWLEGGAMAVVLVVLFVAWLVLRTQEIWRRTPTDVRPIDLLLARAASIGICLVLVHSLVDYPLRTDAMMTTFAFLCALLVNPLSGGKDGRQLALASAREAELVPAVATEQTAAPIAPNSSAVRKGRAELPTAERPSAERWGEGIEWPQEWQNPASSKSTDLRPPIAGSAPRRAPGKDPN